MQTSPPLSFPLQNPNPHIPPSQFDHFFEALAATMVQNIGRRFILLLVWIGVYIKTKHQSESQYADRYIEISVNTNRYIKNIGT